MIPARTSIDLAGHGHGNAPIPAASRVGQLIVTGGIRGVDTTTGTLPKGLSAQIDHMFANLRTIIEKAGGRVETIAKVTVWIAVPEARSALNGPWQAIFPDRDSSPARHIVTYDLPGGMLVQCDAIALAVDAQEI